MMELTIKEKTYQFNFGIGFLRVVNDSVKMPLDGRKSVVERSIGLRYKLGELREGNTAALAFILEAANFGRDPKVKTKDLEEYIESCENIDALFDEVWRFLESANATKKMVATWKKEVAEELEAAKNA
jgi:hypothetical protein